MSASNDQNTSFQDTAPDPSTGGSSVDPYYQYSLNTWLYQATEEEAWNNLADARTSGQSHGSASRNGKKKSSSGKSSSKKSKKT